MLNRLATIIAAAMLGALLLTFGQLEWSISQQPPPYKRAEPAKPENRNAQGSQTITNPTASKRSDKRNDEGYRYNFFERPTDWFLALFTGLLVLYTRRLYKATAGLVTAAADQSSKMLNSITEAARSATAMEGVATIISQNARRQLRAYVAVIPGDHVVQDDTTGLKFEFHPTAKNNGFTPAYEFSIKARTVFEPYPLPPDFNFALTVVGDQSVATLGFQQTMFNVTFLDRLLTPDEIDELKSPTGRRLYVYGDITYKDIFGSEWMTNFSYYILWGPKGPAWFSTKRHNDAT